MPAAPLRVVVVGFGPVGARFCDEILPAVRAGAIALTVVGAEHAAPYNRVLVAELAVGHTVLEDITLHDPAETAAAGADVRLGVRVVAVDREARTVTLSDGARIGYDRLVLATGARANVPTLDGVERRTYDAPTLGRAGEDVMGADPTLPAGVTALRDLADAARVGAAVGDGARIVVLGAGVLGLEFALLAARSGAQVCVVHHGPTPMPRNLDRGGGTVVARRVRASGVAVVAHSRAEAIAFRTDETGERRFDALVTADGKYLHGDLLVLSCGVGARAELATVAGLRTAAGVVVDRELHSWSDPHVFAIGDCAQVVDPASVTDTAAHIPGAPAGLIGPGWRQAEWLAARISAESAGIPHLIDPPAERPAVVMLKGDAVDVVAAGLVDADPWDEPYTDDPAPHRHVAQWADPEHGRYVKMVSRAGVLEGFVSVGMPRTAAELTLLFERGGELPADRSLLLRLDGPDDEPGTGADLFAPTATVCWCNGVTVERIQASVAAGNDTVACLGKDTRAGTGCGGCKGRLAELIERFDVAARA